MNWLDELVNDYYKWLKSKTTIIADNQTGWTAINTPFIGIFNDTLEIFAKKDNNKIILSDDGATIHNLELSGAPITRSLKRKDIMEKILLNYGVLFNEKELIIEANESDFAQKKHNLLSAISEINDLYVLAKHTISSIFKEDVKGYLDSQDLVYTPQFISRGSTGIEFTFDFQIAYKTKEIVIKSFNSVNKFNLPHFLFTWNDIKEAREKITQKQIVGLAIVNDEDKEVKSEYLTALKSKGADYIIWSERHNKENLIKLAA